MEHGAPGTERLEIEPLVAAHAAALFVALRDPRVYEFIPASPPAGAEQLEARYRMLETRSSPDGSEAWLNWAVRWRDGGEYVGRLEATVRSDGTALIAYELSPECWGKGVGSEAARWLLDELAAAHGVREVRAEVDTRNLASIRLLERLGFERVGLKENADWFKGATSHEYTYRWRPAPGPEPRRAERSRRSDDR